MTAELKEILHNEPITIGFFGVIASGKSTLGAALGERLSIEPVEEKFRENPFLTKFYVNPLKWSYRSQKFFFIEKIRQLKNLDYSESQLIVPAIEMDLGYALTLGRINFMRPDKVVRYKTRFNDVYGSLQRAGKIKKPDLFIWTDAPNTVLAKRIVERGRPYELKILKEYPYYLSELRGTIEKIIHAQNLNVVYVDTTKINYSDEIHMNGLIEKIKRNLK